MGQTCGFLRSVFRTFWLCEPKCTENWFDQIFQYLSTLVSIWPDFCQNMTALPHLESGAEFPGWSPPFPAKQAGWKRVQTDATAPCGEVMTYSDGWSPGCVHSCPVSPVTTACADLSRLTIKPLSPIASASHVYKDLWFDKVMFFSALIWRGNPAGMSDLSQKWFNLAPNGTKHGYCQIIFQFQFILSRRAKVVHILCDDL